MMRWSKSSPPRKVSPLVASTSNWCSPSMSAISMIEMSKVPPPRSYTAICDAPGVLGRLTLAVVEVGGHRDDGFGDFLAEVVFGSLLHLAQHFGRHLWR